MEHTGKESRAENGNNWKKTVLLTVLCYLLTAAALTFLVDDRHPHFYMSGEQEMEAAYGEAFEDPGVYAVLRGRIFGEGDSPLPLERSGKVDTCRLGSYELVYSSRYLLRDYRCSRIVRVVDAKAPVLSLTHRDGYRPNWLNGYEEEGYTATDDVDGDVTDCVRIEITEAGLRYTVADSAGNVCSVLREPDYTIGKPKLMLIGEKEMHVAASFRFEDPGCRAEDSRGNDLSALIQVTGNVVPYESGEYRLYYTITNAAGESVQTERSVVVESLRNPDVVSPEQPTIYLTFDDGPGPYTNTLLDVLAKYNVKASFFITCNDPAYYTCIGRAFREGHSIGVHTASHEYKRIYASEEAFFEDFRQAEELIYEQTGEHTHLCRFPGGSSNTVSSFNPGIMSRLAKDLTEMGYQYYDWDVVSGDAGETTKTETVYQNVVNGVQGRPSTIVLQHDIKGFSVAAVERIINWGLSNGYVFQALNISSPNAHHEIAN
ncbi:MAG: polysaccharide deacetylase family protein [Oscillospiraceae bacterium]|nr:polysaccharide deacetylase family protein [Oscillospiraceae bacterium]